MEAASLPLIEYLRSKIYLGAFDYVPEDTETRVYLTVDDSLPYNNFHHDFGPLSIGHLYRFAVMLHDVLGMPENQGKELVFYSYTDPRSRANAATLLASYMIIIQSWQPHQVLAPIAQMHPVMPFRDAGYSVADFIITTQDMVYALWRAKNHGLLELRDFDLEEYEQHELVENGDLNTIGEHFVAFASPVTGNSSIEPVLRYFKKHDVRLVVRLNSHLYDKRIFQKNAIKHIDLIFDDGTCPAMAFVQGFIGAAEGVIREGGKIAVHCRAGLGRTGCLIGAHLIYTYGFTAQEAIAYMRFLRPGMVVGPQQHWLYQHQHEFRDWKRTMRLGRTPDAALGGYSPLVDVALVSAASQARLGGKLGSAPHTPERNILTPRNPATVNACLPQPTPGQPRKPPSPIRSVRPASAVPFRASRYQSVDIVTNSDDDDDDEGSVNDESEELQECTAPFEEEADIIISGKHKAAGQQPLVTKARTAARVHAPRSATASLSSNTSSSRSSSRSSTRSLRAASKQMDSENTGIVMLRQRRNITDLANPSQQLALAKQLRVASNPSPRLRSRREEPEAPEVQAEAVTTECK